mgnify:CR=1 FL=1
MNIFKFLCLLVSTISTIGCDATIGKISSVGKEATITCFSGGERVIEEKSSGKILSEPGSGYYFRNQEGYMIEIDMPCIIKYSK